MTTIQSVKGMNDIFEDDAHGWRHVEDIARKTFIAYGFGEIRTPIVEELQLFARGVGEDTDIVGKEMFTFADRDPKNPKQLCLKPENTAGVVRALIEAGKVMADATQKVFYLAPLFRNERPQLGRYRQFHQIGCEVLGLSTPESDVEVIALAASILTSLGIQQAGAHRKLLLNSLGSSEERAAYRTALVAYLSTQQDQLSDDSKRRLATNPLRVLDSKDPSDRAIVEHAPSLLDHLGDASRTHFERVKQGLQALDIDFVVDERLVRGLDYYAHTVFEFTCEAGLGAQATVCGGGRYDGLVEILGGRPTPAVGFAMGVERLLLVARALHTLPLPTPPTIALIGADDPGRAFCRRIAYQLRARGIRVDVDVAGKGVGAQMKTANKRGTRYTLVVGADEVTSGQAELKDMGAGHAQRVALDDDTIAAALADVGVAAPIAPASGAT